jgi:hypothetical protein
VFASLAPSQSYQRKGLWYETYSSQVLLFVTGQDDPAIEFAVTNGGTFNVEPTCFISGELASN